MNEAGKVGVRDVAVKPVALDFNDLQLWQGFKNDWRQLASQIVLAEV